MRWVWFLLWCWIVLLTLEFHAHAHNLAELRDGGTVESNDRQAMFICPVPNIDQPTKLISAGYDIVAKIYWRSFDLNSNLRADFYVEYELSRVSIDENGPKITVRPFPYRYYLDSDHDGFYDQFYRDVKGDGRCQDLVPYEPTNRDPKDH